MTNKRIEVHTALSILLQATADKARADMEYEQARDKLLVILNEAFPIIMEVQK
jgi:hypothetical protein